MVADMTFWVTGAGNAIITMENFRGAKDRIESQLTSDGFRVKEVYYDENNTIVKLEWNNFNKVRQFQKMTLNSDFSLTLDCGNVDELSSFDGEVFVTVPGKIISEEGIKLEPNRVKFNSGQVTVTYWPTVFYYITLAFILGLGGFVYWFFKKRNRG